SVRAAGGPAAMDAMRRGLKGYSAGGYVGSFVGRPPPVPAMGATAMTYRGGDVVIHGNVSQDTMPDLRKALAAERERSRQDMQVMMGRRQHMEKRGMRPS